jgi:hypothetical protein
MKPCLKTQNRGDFDDKTLACKIKIGGFGCNMAVFFSLFVLFYAVIRYLLHGKSYQITL